MFQRYARPYVRGDREWNGYTVVRGTEIPPKGEAEVRRLLREAEKRQSVIA